MSERFVWDRGEVTVTHQVTRADPWVAEQMSALGLTARALTHEPIGRPGGPGVWGLKGKQFPAYFQHIRNDLMEAGHPEAEAHSLAWGILRNFAAGHDGKGNRVSADTQRKAIEALAEMKKLQAEAKATRSTAMSGDTYDSDGLDASWDGSHDDLPDMSGLATSDFDAAAEGSSQFSDWGEPGGQAQRMAKLGTGGRFAALKASLAAKGVRDPGALAAKIGRRKYGKAKFQALASAARKRSGGGKQAMATRFGELYRTWPLEDCRLLDRSDGEQYGSGRVVEAYAAIYDAPAEIRDREGHYVETIRRGAFDQVLRAIHPDRNGGYWNVGVLYNHGMTVHGTPAERFSMPCGVTQHISSEGKGLLTRTEYANTPLGDEILELVNMGALRTQSFTGDIVRSNPPLRGPGDRYRGRGGVLPQVQRIQLGLREYGLTPFAAYSGAEVLGVRMQLPEGYEALVPEYEDAYPDEGDGDGFPPEDGSSAPSTGHRLYALRSRELYERAGISLPGREE